MGDSTPAGNFVEGNLIGIDRDGNPAGNSIGVYIQNSWGNQIGGPGSGKNVISANAQAGVELTGLYATRNTIVGNDIGTDATGTMRPGNVGPLTAVAPSSLQTYGVYINTPSPSFDPSNTQPNNEVLDNVVSGNLIGVQITGVGTGQGVPLGLDVISGNLIGTDPSGNSPNPNFEYGVYIENSAGNTVGGSTPGSRNILSANGIDGVEIFGGTSQASRLVEQVRCGRRPATSSSAIPSATIARADRASPAPAAAQVEVPDGPTITLGEQLYGVVIIGSSGNIIGSKTVGNLIGGNLEAGVYITRVDFQGNVFSVPTGNTLNSNTIADNGIYGVYRFESPDNPVAMRPQRHANKFRGNVINLEDYIKSLNSNTQLPRPKSRFAPRKTPRAGKVPPRRGSPSTMPRPMSTTRCRIPCGRGSPRSSATGSSRSGSSMPPPCASARPRAAVRRGAGTPPGPTTSSAPSLVEREVSVSLAAARSSGDDAHHRPDRPH